MEQVIFARFIDNDAGHLNTTVRHYPHGELIIIIEDRVQQSARKHGVRSPSAFKNVARHFVDMMIENGAFSTVKGEFGGSMHKLDTGAYHRVLGDLRRTNPILQHVSAGTPDLWDRAFEQARL